MISSAVSLVVASHAITATYLILAKTALHDLVCVCVCVWMPSYSIALSLSLSHGVHLEAPNVLAAWLFSVGLIGVLVEVLVGRLCVALSCADADVPVCVCVTIAVAAVVVLVSAATLMRPILTLRHCR